MHDYLLSVFLGIVEGLTEFLPVSSTAHLRICEALLHIHLDDPFWKMFAIVIQLGAVLCLPVYFFDRIRELIQTGQFQDLMEFTAADPTFVSRAINAALKRAPSFEAMKEAMETSIGEQTAKGCWPYFSSRPFSFSTTLS